MSIQIPQGLTKEIYFSPKIAVETPFLYALSRCGAGKVCAGFYISRERGYDYSIIHYLTAGSGILITGGHEYLLKAGDLFILRAGEQHIYTSNDKSPMELLWLEFCGANSEQILNTFILRRQRVLHLLDNNEITEGFINLLTYICDHENDQDCFKTSTLIYSILCSLIKFGQSNTATIESYPEWLSKVLATIRNDFRSPLSIAKLAAEVSYHPQYLSRVFSSEMGVTPTQYLAMVRIKQAMNLMSEEAYSAKQLAELLGFYDATHFTKVFKQYTGLTPGKYKAYFANNKQT